MNDEEISVKKLREKIKEGGIDVTVQDSKDFEDAKIRVIVEKSDEWKKHAKVCKVGRIVSMGIGGKPVKNVENQSEFFDEISAKKSLEDVGKDLDKKMKIGEGEKEIVVDGNVVEVENLNEKGGIGLSDKFVDDQPLYGAGVGVNKKQIGNYDVGLVEKHAHELYGTNEVVVGCACGNEMHVGLDGGIGGDEYSGDLSSGGSGSTDDFGGGAYAVGENRKNLEGGSSGVSYSVGMEQNKKKKKNIYNL
tara:strand:- start:29 stop:772 length:744 start_codon:yes stop_codon:yes gene_type:complete